ncbi:MAG TPA: tetratricopeptide repeat protein [Bacteroidia bacterium]|jgi:serine phosphatase RsbU (regulator of sigma subunit)
MKTWIAILVSFITCFFPLFAQEQNAIDSLQKELDKAEIDTLRISIMSELADAWYASDPEQSLRINNEVIRLADEAIPKYSGKGRERLYLYKAASINNLGILAMDRGEVMKAIEYYEQSIPAFEESGYHLFLAKSYNNIGFVYENQGDIERGLEYYFKSLKLRETINDYSGIGESYNNIAYIYQAQGDLKKSLETFMMALTFFEKVNDQIGIALIYNNVGGIYKKTGEYRKALEHYQKSSAIRKKLEDHKTLSSVYGNIGDTYRKLGIKDSAKFYFEHSLREAKIANNKSRMASAADHMAIFLYDEGDLSSALKYAEEGLKLSIELGFPERMRESYETVSLIYEKKGDYKQAFLAYKGFKEMSDSLLSDETKQEAIKQQMKYSFDKRELEITKEKEKSELEHEAEVKQQRMIIYSSVAGLLIVLVFSFFLYNRFRVTRQQKAIIEKQKNIVEEQKEMVELQKEMVDEKNKEITDSINYAKRIQQAILPPARLIKQFLPQSFVYYQPKDIVAGDFYWLEASNGNIVFAAADCTGHGVPGAMVSVVCHNALNRSVREFRQDEPGKILDKTRDLVIETFEKSDQEVKDGMDISLCKLNQQTSELQWSGANNPLWIIRNNSLIEYKADKQPIGKFENARPFTTHSVPLEKNDMIYIFTDGYADQFGGEKGKKFKYKQLQELLLSIAHLEPETQKQMLEAALGNWKGNLEQVDDVCIFGVRFAG